MGQVWMLRVLCNCVCVVLVSSVIIARVAQSRVAQGLE